jgi:hypothetical protein
VNGKTLVVPLFAVEQAERLGREFSDDFYGKFLPGQVKHGGNVMRMPATQLIQEAKYEVLDQWSYIKGIEQSVKETHELLLSMYAEVDELDGPTNRLIELIDEATERLDG